MKRNAKLLVLFILLVIISMNTVAATTYKVGRIKEGDWAKYVYKEILWAPDPWQPEPQFIKDLRAIQWNKVVVEEIEDTTITVSITTFYKDDTTDKNTFYGDIKTGEGNLGTQMIAGNLGVGDKVHLSGIDTPILIRETYIKEYAGASRMVNFASFSTYVKEKWTFYEVYWDKETGFECALRTRQRIDAGTFTIDIRIILVMMETNMWGTELRPIVMLWVGVIIGSIVVLATFFLIKKK